MNPDNIKDMITILNQPQVVQLLSDTAFLNIFLKGKKEDLNENQLHRINYIIQNKELMTKMAHLHTTFHKYI